MKPGDWEEHHARVTAELARRNAEGISNNAIADIAYEVAVERANQDAKWGKVGEALNHPSVVQGLIGPAGTYGVGLPTEDEARAACGRAADQGKCTWSHIAVEELCEAVDASDDIARRAELVQLAAVVFSWIECIDIRTSRGAK